MEEEEADKEWVVEAVEDEKLEGGRNEFLVRWEGYAERTWECEEFMDNARDKIEEFRKKKQITEQRKSKEKKQEDMEEGKEEEQYTVERILEMKVQNGQKSFLIKWEGFEKPTLGTRNQSWERNDSIFRSRKSEDSCMCVLQKG